MERSFKSLAETIILKGATVDKLLGQEFEFRKGKGLPDLDKASKRGVKQGRGKIETEISMLEIQLQKIIKRK